MSYLPRHAPERFIEWRALASTLLVVTSVLVVLLGVFG